MNIVVIMLYLFSIVFGLLILCAAYLVITYLNKKALGMQTLVDQMVKDAIYLWMFLEIINSIILRLILEFSRPISYSLAVLETIVSQFSVLTFLWQLNMIFLMRYLYVFHYANLNIVDEKLIKRLTRCTVLIVSTISIQLTMAMVDVEKNMLYQHLTDGDLMIPVLNPVIILTVTICLVIIIITQFKIEMFKKSVDAKQFDQMESGEDDQGHKCKTGEHNP